VLLLEPMHGATPIGRAARPMAKRSLAGLNAINFFQAEMVGVVLPALGSFLKQAHWRYDSIGIATALSGLGTLLLQTIAGEVTDRISSRRPFTGAFARKAGKFEIAHGGTILLDKIGELALPLPPKLLRVLQERAFGRVGGSELIRSDFRLIAATNCNLDELVQDGESRQDLYYQLNAFVVSLPPLRRRRADIVPLAEHFRDVCAARNKTPAGSFSEEALAALQQYSYPGNVREQEHIVERALLQAQGRVILAEHLPFQRAVVDAKEHWIEELTALPLHASVAEWERFRIRKALTDSAGNKAEAARRLGIHRRLLYEKLKAFGLGSDSAEQPNS
jgi:DNA-binding NtrC family response regulator